MLYKRAKILSLFIFFSVAVSFLPKIATAHPLTVWTSKNMAPAMTEYVGNRIEVWVTVPDPLLTPLNSLFSNLQPTGDLAVATFYPDGSKKDISLLGYFSTQNPEWGLVNSPDTRVLSTDLQKGFLDITQEGTTVITSTLKTSSMSTIRHFSKSFINARKDGIITKRFAPRMRSERIEIVPLDDADKLIKGNTVRFQIYYENTLIKGDTLKDWVQGITPTPAPAEFSIGYAYPKASDTSRIDRKPHELYDMTSLDTVNFDYTTGIISAALDKAAVWGIEVYKPRSIEPNPRISQFSTLTFDVKEKEANTPTNEDNGSEGNGCNTAASGLLFMPLCFLMPVLGRKILHLLKILFK